MNEQSKTIDDLRTALFSALEGVRAGTLDLDKARAMNEIGKTIVESAKVEVQYLEATGGGESTFISSAIGAANVPKGLPNGTRTVPQPEGGWPPGITSVTQHRLQG